MAENLGGDPAADHSDAGPLGRQKAGDIPAFCLSGLTKQAAGAGDRPGILNHAEHFPQGGRIAGHTRFAEFLFQRLDDFERAKVRGNA